MINSEQKVDAEEGTFQVKQSSVLLVQDSSGNVRHIAASIAFTGSDVSAKTSLVGILISCLPSHINLEVLNAECVFKILQETDEIVGNFFLRFCCCCTHCVSSPNRLLDPKHVCEIDPRVLVDIRSC